MREILKTESIKKYILSAGIIAAVVLILELTVFNFRFYQTLGNENVVPGYTVSDNLKMKNDIFFTVTDDSYVPYLEITDLDIDLSTIYMELTFPKEGVYAVKALDFHYEVKDEGTDVYYSYPMQKFLRLVPATHFTYPENFGNTHAIKLCFDGLKEGEQIRIEALRLNEKVPMRVSKKRMIALWLIIMFFFMFRPKSFLYNFKAAERTKVKIIAVTVLVVAEALLSLGIVSMNDYYKNPTGGLQERQFALLAEALSQGETHLLVDVPDSLINMEDPYDYGKRMEVTNDEALFDVAYKDGKYFVYFGVGPVVMLYLPYYLATGCELPNYIAQYIFCLLIIAGVPFLLSEISKRWFKDISLAFYMMFTVLFTFGCGTIYYVVTPSLYNIPMASGLGFTILGLAFWLRSIREDKISALDITLGSLCLALTASCRPTYLLAAAFAVPFYFNAVFKKRTLFSKQSLAATLGFVIPFAAVGALVMYYNYDRFGSVTDFGAFYNLTTANLPLRTMKLSWILYGTVGWLFYPCTVSNVFPYFTKVTYSSNFQALTEFEKIYGGIIYNNIYLSITLLFFLFKRFIKDKRLYIYTAVTPFICLFFMIFDNRNGGVNTRYVGDFGFYMFVSAFIIICYSIRALKEYANSSEKVLSQGLYKTLTVAFFVIFIVTVIRFFLAVYGADGGTDMNATLHFYTASHLVEFWH